MSEMKEVYRVNVVASTREYKCACGEVLGYMRNLRNRVVLLRLTGDIIEGDGHVYCPTCQQHRQFVEVLRPVPAFLDPHREREREELAALLEEARQIASNK